MTLPYVSTASLVCSFGMAPSTLNVLPVRRVLIEGKPVATVEDVLPMLNIPPFGMCTSLSNPTVASAAAAAGVLTPMPCVPVPVGPWKPPSASTLVGGTPVASEGATCNCSWGGVITATFPGSVRTVVNCAQRPGSGRSQLSPASRGLTVGCSPQQAPGGGICVFCSIFSLCVCPCVPWAAG